MICDWIFDDFEQLFLRIGRTNRESMEELNHQASETFECPRYSDGGADLDEYALGGMDVDLQSTGFVDR